MRKDFETKVIKTRSMVNQRDETIEVPAVSDYFYNGRRYYRTHVYNSCGQEIIGGSDGSLTDEEKTRLGVE